MTRRTETIDALASAPKDLRRVTRRFLEDPDENATAILKQMVTLEINARRRFRMVAAGKPVTGIQSRDLPDSLDQDMARLLEQFEEERRRTIDLLESLSLAEWQRKAIFENGRQDSLRTLVQRLVTNDTEYLTRLISIKRK